MDFPLPVLSSRSDQISPSVWKARNFSLGELQAGNRRVILTHAHEAFRVGTGTGEVVPHGFHQGYLPGLRQLEFVNDAPVDDLLGRQYEQHVRVAR